MGILRTATASASATLVSARAASTSAFDAVVVGGGHNGLVAAAYMAKSGKKVCVLERRPVVGGAAVTEEIVPGYRFSRASYLLSLLRPKVYHDLELKRHGLKVFWRNPSSYTPLRKQYRHADGAASLTLGSCGQENKRQIARFSPKDAEAFHRYETQLNSFVDIIDPLLDHSPRDLHPLLAGSGAGFWAKLCALRRLRPSLLKALRTAAGTDVGAFYELLTAPTTKVLNKWFESEPLKATLATDACIGAMVSPNSPGSGYVLLHHVMGDLEGVRGAWGYPEGGMGGVSKAIASAAQEAGVQIETGACVEKILVEKGLVVGVGLKDGRTIESSVVLSNATPKVTFLDLMDASDLQTDFLHAVKSIDYTSPVTKINVAVNRLPNFLADPNDPNQPNAPRPHHQCTIHLNCESSELLESAFHDAYFKGIVSQRPMIEMVIPSVLDSSLAPAGHHVCLFFTQYTPFNLDWNDAAKEDYARLIFDTVEEYAPGFKASVVGKEVLTPPDLEREFGLTGGNIFHGAMSLDQLYLTRPLAPKTSQRAFPDTPVAGLFLCGSGSHPGGGVMGAPGRLAAMAALHNMGVKWKFQV